MEPLIFYDGKCGLCHGFIRFVVRYDAQGVFKFAPLQSAAFDARVPEELRRSLPDSVVVSTSEGQVLARSAAVAYVLQRLGGSWAVAGRLLSVLPKRPTDAAYDAVAAVRHRLFAPPADACPLMPSELRARFLT